MRIGVIIITYNGERWISDCLKSLSFSTVKHEIVIVDNSSNDQTLRIIKDNFDHSRIIELKKNIGFGRANNEGLKIALKEKWDYTFLLNQDTKVFPDTIKNLVSSAKMNEGFGIISPIHLDSSGNKLDHSFNYYLKRNSHNNFIDDAILKKSFREIYDFKMINAAAWLLPYKTLKIVGGFHPMFFLYGEDDNYCQRVEYHSLKIGAIPNAFIIHDSENNNLNTPTKDSPQYYHKFLNQIKVEYGNPNTNNFQKLPRLKRFYYRVGIKALLQLKFRDFIVNWKKAKLVSKLKLEKEVWEMREVKSNYLNKSSY